MTAAASVRLYELANARDILDVWLAEAEGEVTPELEQLLAELDGKIEEKIERVALFIREQLATADAVESEIKRLGAIVAARRRAADGLKEYLKRQLERLGRDKVQGLLCTVTLQSSPPSVKSTLTVEQLAELYFARGALAGDIVQEVPAIYRLNARAVMEAHKANLPLPEGISVEQSKHVRIR